MSGIFSSIESVRLLFVATQCPAIHQADDLLLIYTDGITEATNRAGEEFGDQRLASLLHELRGQSAEAALESVFAGVQQYTAGEQSDDLAKHQQALERFKLEARTARPR